MALNHGHQQTFSETIQQERKESLIMKSVMRKTGKKGVILAAAVFMLAALASCGQTGKSGTQESPQASSGTDSAASASSAEAAASSSISAAAAGSSSEAAATSSAPAEAEGAMHHVRISVENYGDIVLELDGTQAPITVDNFISLAKSGFYDGLTFHRIMDGFMIQGGDPLGNGTGGSENTIKGEFKSNGVENTISHKKGVISMARAADPDSASSQFFITVADSVFLDGEYAAFGHVTEGQDVCDKIAADAKPTDNNGTIPREEQPVISKIEVID